MQTVRMKLSELHKTDKNIRMHSEKQIQEYVRSLQMFGQTRPFVATEDGEILVGNGMYDAMLAMGAEEGDVYVIAGLSKAERRKLMLADNKVYELGITNVAALDDILADLGKDFDVPGYDADLLETLSASTFEADDLVGDYGTDEIEFAPKRQETPVTYADDPTPQYAPPVRVNGEFLPPEAKVEAEAETEAEAPAGRYIICPHCGEKIWL